MDGGKADGESGTNTSKGGIAMGAGSEADGANGYNGGMALGPGSDADGGGIAEDGGHTHPCEHPFPQTYSLEYVTVCFRLVHI
jgi:hypothetical protein